MTLKAACAAGGIHMVEVAIPAAGLDTGQQRIAHLRVGKAPDAKEAVLTALVDTGFGFCQSENFDTQTGQAPMAEPMWPRNCWRCSTGSAFQAALGV